MKTNKSELKLKRRKSRLTSLQGFKPDGAMMNLVGDGMDITALKKDALSCCSRQELMIDPAGVKVPEDPPGRAGGR